MWRLLGVIAAVLIVGTLAVTPVAAPEPQPKIAVVDLQELFENLEEKVDMNVDLNVLSEKAKQALEALKADHDKLKEQLRFLDEASDKYKATKKQLDDLETLSRARLEEEDKKIRGKTAEFTKRIYEKMVQEIAAYAKVEGFALVLKSQKPDLADTNDLLEINRRIGQRIVLYSGGVVDVTSQIIRIMNDKYAQSKGKGK